MKKNAFFLLFVSFLIAMSGSTQSAFAKPPKGKTVMLASVSPSFVVGGDTVSLSGSQFGKKASTVLFGTTPAAIQSWSNSLIIATVPSALPPGTVQVTVVVKNKQSNSRPVTIRENAWASVTGVDAAIPRYLHTVVWTGSEMIVWGGLHHEGGTNTGINMGGRYNPATDTWLATTTTGAPSGRWSHGSVWASNQMIVWGGYNGVELNSGGRYFPTTDSWSETSLTGAPSARHDHTAVWTGSEMIVWGGYDQSPTATFPESGPRIGGRYNPTADTWTATNSVNTPLARFAHTAVWTGSRMLIWGGAAFTHYYGDGASYNPTADDWSPLTNDAAPVPRGFHTAVWTGSAMVIWGGEMNAGVGESVDTGGRYFPDTNSWAPTSTLGTPGARSLHEAVWTGGLMFVWGGANSNGAGSGQGADILSTGGLYDPQGDKWYTVSNTDAPAARYFHTMVWDGNEAIVWGGRDSDNLTLFNDGGKYRP